MATLPFKLVSFKLDMTLSSKSNHCTRSSSGIAFVSTYIKRTFQRFWSELHHTENPWLSIPLAFLTTVLL